jgi:hypothetical protein
MRIEMEFTDENSSQANDGIEGGEKSCLSLSDDSDQENIDIKSQEK